MDSRKGGLNSFSKKGCFGIGLGAVFSTVFTIISMFADFGIKRKDTLTALLFLVSAVLIVGFVVALRQLEDPSKMILEFHPPKATHRNQIASICENIYKNHTKQSKPLYVIVYPALLGLISFELSSAIVPLSQLVSNIVRLFTNSFLLPAVFTGLIAFFIWDIIYRNRMEEIQNSAYAIAEVAFSEKYYCISPGKTSQSVRTSYFVILEDSHGNKGRFKVCEDEYYKFREDNTILLVKRSKGGLFYNDMEPVVILE